MKGHLIDTEIKLATCNRCGSYVFACRVSGVATAADPEPLDVEGYRAALIAGRRVYDVITQEAGRPWKLAARTAAVSATPRVIIAAHACGALGLDSTSVTEVAAVPRPAPASAMAGSAGALAALGASEAAPSATPLRSEPAAVCGRCGVVITGDAPRWSVVWGSRVVWAEHDGLCP